MKKVNIYDFDKTIYYGDTSIDFYLFCIKRHIKIIKTLPRQLKFALMYKINKCSKERLKSEYFSFLKEIKNIEIEIELFWNKYGKKINYEILSKSKGEIVVISASPDFLLRPICEKLHINCLIASNVDIKTGKFIGKNCYGKEKVKRFKDLYKECEVVNAYSDSLSDLPMLNLAKNQYLVKKNKYKKIN